MTHEAIAFAQGFRRNAGVNQNRNMRLDLLNLFGKIGARVPL